LDELVLEVENRRRIFESVCKYPGVHLRELSRIVDLKLNLVDYHLIYLERRGFVYPLQDGIFKRYYPKDIVGAEHRRDLVSAPDKPLLGLLRQPVPFRIIVLLAKRGTATHKDLTDALHKSSSTVSHHIGKLVIANVLVKEPDGRGYSLSDPARMERLLLAFTPQPSSLADGFIEIWENLYI